MRSTISGHLRACAAAALLLVPACHPMDPAAAIAAERNTNYAVPFNTVAFLDPGLKRNIVAEQTGSKRSPTNTLVAYTLLRNRTDDAVKVSVRTRFFDADKLPIDDSGWSLLFLDRRGLQTYEIPSSSANAAYYYIEVMHGR